MEFQKNEATAFVGLLRVCAKKKDLRRGTRVHDDILSRGLLEKCSDALVSMYAKCGALAQSKDLLDMHKSRNPLTWAALIAGYTQKGQGHNALHYFERMQREGISPDVMTFTCILRACGSIGALDKGKRIHDEIAKQGLLESNIVLGNTVVNMYAKCGALAKARQVLEELPVRNVVSWNILITGYAQHGKGEQALKCFQWMQQDGLSPNEVTFTCILNACGSIGAAHKGQQIHDEIAKQGFLRNNVVLGNALVDMYAKCGALRKAQRVFEELPVRNIISWNALISGYAQHGKAEQTLNCFEGMQHEGLCPDAVTFTCVLKACGSIGAADKGKHVHDEIAKQGLLGSNIVLGNALVDMYAKCGALAKARQVLEELRVRDVISWSALIAGYAQHDEGEQALECFEEMQREGISPDAMTFTCILRACGRVGAVDKGEKIHDEITKQGLLGNNVVLGTALVDMYAKCSSLTKARQVLEELPIRSVITWNALITGYVRQGEGVQVLNCFEEMQREGLSPDVVTFICILQACGSIGAGAKGENIHNEIAEQGLLGNDIVLGTTLIDMYAKCGALTKARRVLEELPVRNVISWNALIAGYVQQGEGEQALDCFEQMQREGLSPNASTFSCMLSACSRSGLVEDAQMYFVNMCTKYGMKPDLEHYTSMVDIFGLAGHLDKALRVLQKFSFANSGVCSALLGVCRKWGDMNAGKWAFDHVVQPHRSDAAVHVLNIYTVAGLQEDAEIVASMRKENKAWKKSAQNRWMGMSEDMHSIFVENRNHAQSKHIYVNTEDLATRSIFPNLASAVTKQIC